MAQLTMENSATQVISIEVVRTMAALAALREQWTALFDAAHNASPPLHFDWIWKWLELRGKEFVDANDGLRVICCRCNGKLIAALPLYQRRPLRLADGGKQLRFISTGEREQDELCPDYMDMLCLDEGKEQCADLVWGAICGDMKDSYDRLEFSDVADDSVFVKWARASGAASDLQIIPRGVCPIADLTGGFDAYLSRLSSNSRQQIRRLLRAAKQAGVTMECAATVDQACDLFDEMIELHQKRWTAAGERGCFASASFTEFHRQLIRDWLGSGRVVLTRIRLENQTLAVKYGFRNGSKFDFYQSGVRMDEDCPIRSPGIVSFMMLMQHLIEHGVVTFDFLRGSSNYKQRLATSAQPLVSVRRVRWTLMTTVGFAAEIAGRGIQRAGKLASGTGEKGKKHAESAPSGEQD